MNKRGQATQVFTYVITVLIVGLVLVLGYNGIASLLKTGEETQMIEFRSDMQSAIKKGASYGRISTFEFNTGGDYEQVCFADRGALEGMLQVPPNTPPLVTDAIQTAKDNPEEDDKTNVFVLQGDIIHPITADPIELGGNIAVKCFNMSRGRITLKFRGQGDATEVIETVD